ncbi:hypothetical protein F4859DRAFT_516716 [Xylaria cf. heliscus]|nr:hypothetical protein F4859DRAFT_516716 [Xylaria cf. heliscus]
MSARKRALREKKGLPRSDGEQLRLDFKESLFSIFIHFAGFEGNRCHMFGLNHTANGGIHVLILASTLCINLADRAVVLDSAILPLHTTVMPEARKFLPSWSSQGIDLIHVNNGELQLWRRVLPAYVERCRTWDHRPDCEYQNSDKIPLSTENNKPFLGFVTSNVPDWKALAKYAVRAAISPAFWAPFTDDIYRPTLGGIMASSSDKPLCERCASCGKKESDEQIAKNIK